MESYRKSGVLDVRALVDVISQETRLMWESGKDREQIADDVVAMLNWPESVRFIRQYDLRKSSPVSDDLKASKSIEKVMNKVAKKVSRRISRFK
jgi:hypothetical protein